MPEKSFYNRCLKKINYLATHVARNWSSWFTFSSTKRF